jgi:hypothetical protein
LLSKLPVLNVTVPIMFCTSRPSPTLLQAVPTVNCSSLFWMEYKAPTWNLSLTK